MEKTNLKKLAYKLEQENASYIDSYNKNIHKLEYLFYAVFGLWLFALLFYFYFLYSSINDPIFFKELHHIALYPLILFSPLLLIVFTSSRRIKKGVENHINLWKRKRIDFLLQMFSYTAIGVYSFLYRDINLISKSFISLSCLMYFIFIMTVFLIKLNPKLILSNLVNSIGGICFNLTSLAFLYFAFFSFIDNKYSTTISIQFEIIGFIVITLLWIVGVLFLRSKGKKLSYTQFSAIKIINPRVLFTSLRNEELIINDKKIAINLKKNLEKNLDYGALTEFNKMIVRENSNKSYVTVGTIVFLLLFIIDAIGQRFFQDLFYDGFLKIQLCKLFSVFC